MAGVMPGGDREPSVHAGDLVLERYRVVEQIASGGHSVVYRGQDERLSRPVCIKVFSGFGGESGVGRTSYEHFVQEAFALSRLTHPNTLRIYDFGHLGPQDTRDLAGQPVQVCEYMNGGTLSERVKSEGKQTIAEMVRVTAAMCAALAEAHGLGIVHRDIKPQNILFGAVGTTRLPKLADFGIAKWSADPDPEPAGEQRRAEDTQIVAGQKLAMYSPSWAAPEQLSGQGVTAATDIYSLAVVAVYMLSGKAIFADEDVYAGYKKRRHATTLLAEHLGPLGVAPNVIAVLEKALAFDPKKRIHDVEELAAELRAVTDLAITEDSGAGRMVPKTGPLEPVVTLPPLVPSPFETATPVPLPPAPPAPSPPPAPVAPVPPAGPGVRLYPTDPGFMVGDRHVHFAFSPAGTADLADARGNKLRVTLLPGRDGRVVHIKGLSCFVAIVGGRPSPAVQLTSAADISLVTPRAQEIGQVRVANGAAGPAEQTFTLGGHAVSLALEDCADPILFDFGSGSDAFFVYTLGKAPAKAPRRG
jgi:serine/threonine-protein kinase